MFDETAPIKSSRSSQLLMLLHVSHRINISQGACLFLTPSTASLSCCQSSPLLPASTRSSKLLDAERPTERSQVHENCILFPPTISYRTCLDYHFCLGFPLFLARLEFCVDGDIRRRLVVSSHFSVGFFSMGSIIFTPS